VKLGLNSFEKMTIAAIAAFLQDRDKLSPEERALLEADSRRGVINLISRYYKRQEACIQEEKRLQKMLVEEQKLWKHGFKFIAGVDEAGRGPLAGPVVAAAVIFRPGTKINGLNDSKQLSAALREKIFEIIIQEAEAYGIGSASKEEIDEINIHRATLLAMNRALDRLCPKPDFVLVDGFPIADCPYRQKALKGGDTISLSIAAASVLAKVTRDQMMTVLHERYPVYGFDRHMGYGTLEHRSALNEHGPCPAHRTSFRLSF
jgi:ribonuclease HII